MKQKKKQDRFPVRKIEKPMRMKLAGLLIAVLLALVALAVRITTINASSGEEYKRIVLANTQQQYQARTLPFKRGTITDRNGTILASSERVYNLILDCSVVNYTITDKEGKETQPYLEPTVEALTELYGIDEKKIRDILTDEDTKESKYQILKKELQASDKEKFEEYTNTEEASLSDAEKEEKGNVKGVWFEETYSRIYPQDSLMCDLVGFCDQPDEAYLGIEGYYNDTLNGTNGRVFGYYNSDLNVEQTTVEPVDGNNVITTCDVNIQQIIRNAIENYLEKHQPADKDERAAKNIAVVAMDPNSGEILAMDSTDWYDLNDPRDMSGIKDPNELALMDDQEMMELYNTIWSNYCVTETFEPGSVVKPCTVASALETASVQKTDVFDCDGYEYVNDIMIRCSVFPDYHGQVSVSDAIAKSCNDAIMKITLKTGADNFAKYQRIFNFGSRTGIDLPSEGRGILFEADEMGDLELATCGFGQSFTCTMVQEAAAISSIINGGYYYQPHVVKTVTDSEGNVTESKPVVLERRTVSKETSEFLKQAMAETIESGTGSLAKVPGYSMGGKTGTAEKLPREDGKVLVSFIGFAPVEDPQVLIYVVIDEPYVAVTDDPEEKNEVDSSLAQEISKEIFEELFPYLNIVPDRPEELENVPAEEPEEEPYSGIAGSGTITPAGSTEQVIPPQLAEDDAVDKALENEGVPKPPEELPEDSAENSAEE